MTSMMVVNCATLVVFTLVWGLGCAVNFGTGSSRLEDDSAADFNKIVEDTEHIKEEFEDLFSEDDLMQMEHDQIAFTWYTAHNDDDEGLDGLELYKAIKHAKSHETPENGDDQTDEENVQNLVDYLLDAYDLDSNGILEYPEFMKAFEETRAQLGVS
eukprot:08151.XXX_69467_66536_1 [CDS] Oithona nana genome sequencing.